MQVRLPGVLRSLIKRPGNAHLPARRGYLSDMSLSGLFRRETCAQRRQIPLSVLLLRRLRYELGCLVDVTRLPLPHTVVVR